MADTDKTVPMAVIFDRDGVLNIDHGYVGDVQRLEWTPGAKLAVRRLNQAGVVVIVATNQSGVARGYFDEAAVSRVHEAMQADLRALGARIDAFYVCPFHPESVLAAFADPDHPDRKPNPGMIFAALEDWRLDPDRVLLIGDKETDMEAARRAGVTGHHFQGGNLDRFLTEIGALK